LLFVDSETFYFHFNAVFLGEDEDDDEDDDIKKTTSYRYM
jgi:hypothetical protein